MHSLAGVTIKINLAKNLYTDSPLSFYVTLLVAVIDINDAEAFGVAPRPICRWLLRWCWCVVVGV